MYITILKNYIVTKKFVLFNLKWNIEGFYFLFVFLTKLQPNL